MNSQLGPGQEFLEFLRAVAVSDPSKPPPSPIETFLKAHPAALVFVQAPKPTPSSFARETYFGVTAFQFTNKDGMSRYGRSRITPDAGVEHLDGADAKTKEPNFLFHELKDRIATLPVFRFQSSLQTTLTSSTTLPFTGQRIARSCVSGSSF